MLKLEPETLVDIVREMRVCNDHGTPECQYTEDEVDELADRIEAAHKREVSELMDIIDDLTELAARAVYSCCNQCTLRGCPGEEHCCETKDGVETLQRARKMLAAAEGKKDEK